jgi:hypothetical protein
MHDTFRMLFVELMTGTPLLYIMSTRKNRPKLRKAWRTRLVSYVQSSYATFDSGTSTAPDHVDAFPNNVSKLPLLLLMAPARHSL